MGIVAVVLWLFTAWWLGLTILDFFKLKWSNLALANAAAIVGISSLTLATFYLSWFVGFNQTTVLVITLVFFGLCLNQKPPLSFNLKLNGWLLVNLVFWVIWLGLVFKKMLVFEVDGLYAGWVNVWGDWAAHLSYAASFGLGENFPPQMPLLAKTRFGYPFLSDFLPAIWVKLGLDLVPAMLFSAFILAVLLVVALINLGRFVGNNLQVGLLTAWVFLFGGGLGWWWWLQDLSLEKEYTHLAEANIEWINLITSQVIPQRGFLMGFGVALVAYWILWRNYQRFNKKELWFMGGLLTLLPLIQAHALAVLIAMSSLLTLRTLSKKRLKAWVIFWLIVVMGSLPQFVYFYSQSVGQTGFIHWQPGWMSYQTNDPWWWFWIKNIGSLCVLVAAGMYFLKPKWRLATLPFWGIFLLTNLFIFQPWEWDNSKFMTHWFLMVAILASLVVVKGLRSRKKFIKTLVLVLLATSIWSGLLDNLRLINYQKQKIRLIESSDLELSRWVIANTSPDSLWLTGTAHDHWLPVLTGRKVVLGFPGWLWTYGLNYSSQEEAVTKMWQGGSQAGELFDAYGVDYVVIGPHEQRLVENINFEWFANNLILVKQNANTLIYRP